MANISLKNAQPLDLARILDRNQDGKMQIGEEVKLSAAELKIIDANHDESLSTDELSQAMAKDQVVIDYKSNQTPLVQLNPALFKASSNDKTQGIIYGGGVLGLGLGSGIGALVALGTGHSAKSGAEIGALVGTVAGPIASAIYAARQPKAETTYSLIDQASLPDPKKLKTYTLASSGIGAGIGAALGGFGLGRLGVLDMKTSIFIGTTVGATMASSSAICSAASRQKKNKPDRASLCRSARYPASPGRNLA
ncbi:MAG: hypothetical protein ACKVON_03675 [Beijerinckiaceae bacterium]